MQSLSLSLFNGVCLAFGSAVTVVFFAAGILCALFALHHLSVCDRAIFARACRAVGAVVAAFGALLPLRGVSLVGAALSAIWCLILFGALPRHRLAQGAAALLASALFWTVRAAGDSSGGRMQHFGDIVVFVVLPGAFAAVALSGQSDLSEGAREPRIPLEAALAKLGNAARRWVRTD